MKKILILLAAPLLLAQTPDFTGVWQANLEKSKGLPPNTKTLLLIERDGDKLHELTGTYSQARENRSKLTYDLSGKEWIGSWHGAPIKTHSTVSGQTLTVDAKVPGPQGGDIKSVYTLSGDGKTLTVATTSHLEGRDTKREVLYDKQPDSAADPLRKPEETAGAHYKNVQLLKDLPASQFIDTMRAFNMSLGVDCMFCHVQGNFSADDKSEKKMARTMLTLVNATNQQYFGGKQEVRCFTCHQGRHHPQSRPVFEPQPGF
jgi:hypothetical protein